MKIFAIAPQSTEPSERAKRPGDNALFVVLKQLRLHGCEVIGTEVALLPKDEALPLPRREKAIAKHKEADVTLIMGADAVRNIKTWFPVLEAIQTPQPFFYINDPGRIKIELFEKIKDAYIEPEITPIFGYDPNNNTFGGVL